MWAPVRYIAMICSLQFIWFQRNFTCIFLKNGHFWCNDSHVIFMPSLWHHNLMLWQFKKWCNNDSKKMTWLNILSRHQWFPWQYLYTLFPYQRYWWEYHMYSILYILGQPHYIIIKSLRTAWCAISPHTAWWLWQEKSISILFVKPGKHFESLIKSMPLQIYICMENQCSNCVELYVTCY